MTQQTLQQKRLTRKQKRMMQQMGVELPEQEVKYSLTLDEFKPLTDNQKNAYRSYRAGNNLLLHGLPGTGKTYLGMHFAIKDVLSSETPYEKVYIIRSTVPTRNQGFLPGKKQDKEAVYEAPYIRNASKMFRSANAYAQLKQKGVVEFISTSYLRGETFENCIMVVDEINNFSGHELDSVITRAGDNCRVIFCGDGRQTDFTKADEKAGLDKFMRILQNMKSFDHIEFGVDDIVRSGLVRDYIIAKDNLDITF
jgi:phosphate starvation-inducible protein PhoH